MSEWDRIARLGRAHWNRIRDAIDSELDREAERELDAATQDPVVTTQGTRVSPPAAPAQAKPAVDREWALRRLGLTDADSPETTKKRYQALDRKAKKLIRILEQRMIEVPAEADIDRLTLLEAKKLREDLATAYQFLIGVQPTLNHRFHRLEIEPEKKARTPKTTAKPQKPKEGNGRSRRFKSLELD